MIDTLKSDLSKSQIKRVHDELSYLKKILEIDMVKKKVTQ